MQRFPYNCQQSCSILFPQLCITPLESICILPVQGLVSNPFGFVNIRRKQQAGRQLSLTSEGICELDKMDMTPILSQSYEEGHRRATVEFSP